MRAKSTKNAFKEKSRLQSQRFLSSVTSSTFLQVSSISPQKPAQKPQQQQEAVLHWQHPLPRAPFPASTAANSLNSLVSWLRKNRSPFLYAQSFLQQLDILNSSFSSCLFLIHIQGTVVSLLNLHSTKLRSHAFFFSYQNRLSSSPRKTGRFLRSAVAPSVLIYSEFTCGEAGKGLTIALCSSLSTRSPFLESSQSYICLFFPTVIALRPELSPNLLVHIEALPSSVIVK